MKSNDTKFSKGMTLVYNDGRAGHVNVKCVVLSAGRTSMRVMFEDRADTTTISYSDSAWMDFLSVAEDGPIYIECRPDCYTVIRALAGR